MDPDVSCRIRAESTVQPTAMLPGSRRPVSLRSAGLTRLRSAGS